MDKQMQPQSNDPILFSFNNNITGNTSTSEMKLGQCMSFFLKGKRALDSNETDRAIEFFKAAVDNLGKDKMSLEESATFYSYLGLAYQKKGWKEYARAHFNKALKLNPKEPVALKNINGAEAVPEKINPSFGEKLKSFFQKKQAG
jgi:Flp pilus assembly protein TadD